MQTPGTPSCGIILFQPFEAQSARVNAELWKPLFSFCCHADMQSRRHGQCKDKSYLMASI